MAVEDYGNIIDKEIIKAVKESKPSMGIPHPHSTVDLDSLTCMTNFIGSGTFVSHVRKIGKRYVGKNVSLRKLKKNKAYFLFKKKT